MKQAKEREGAVWSHAQYKNTEHFLSGLLLIFDNDSTYWCWIIRT